MVFLTNWKKKSLRSKLKLVPKFQTWHFSLLLQDLISTKIQRVGPILEKYFEGLPKCYDWSYVWFITYLIYFTSIILSVQCHNPYHNSCHKILHIFISKKYHPIISFGTHDENLEHYEWVFFFNLSMTIHSNLKLLVFRKCKCCLNSLWSPTSSLPCSKQRFYCIHLYYTPFVPKWLFTLIVMFLVVFFLRLFWVGHMKTSLWLILFRFSWTHAMFFIDSSDIKFGTFVNYVFHNMVTEIGIKKSQQHCRQSFWDGGSL